MEEPSPPEPIEPVAEIAAIVKAGFAKLGPEEQDRLLAMLDDVTKEIRDQRRYAGLDPKTAARRKGTRERVRRSRQKKRSGGKRSNKQPSPVDL
jgi:hypothetical protein